jgi:hypothetical protein
MAKTKQMCCGCYNNFYNINIDGGCWSYKDAKIVTKVEVGTWQDPPYLWTPIKILNCFHKTGSSFLDKNDCRVVKNKTELEKWNTRKV